MNTPLNEETIRREIEDRVAIERQAIKENFDRQLTNRINEIKNGYDEKLLEVAHCIIYANTLVLPNRGRFYYTTEKELTLQDWSFIIHHFIGHKMFLSEEMEVVK